VAKRTSIAKKKSEFNPHAFLSTIGKGRDMLRFQKKNSIFAQGDATDGLFFIQKGKVRLSVVSEARKEATLGILSEGDFFGEGGLAGQPQHMSSAITVTDCVLLHIEKKAMMQAMNLEPKLSAMFLKYLLSEISDIRMTSLINFSIPVKSGWHECFCSWRNSEKKECPKCRFPD